MKKQLMSIAALAMFAGAAQAQVVLSEVYENPAGGDDEFWEFIELYGQPGMSLDGYALALIKGGMDPDGDGNANEVPEIDEAFTLDGLTIGANGFLVLYHNGDGFNEVGEYLMGPFAPAGSAVAGWSGTDLHIPSSDTGGKLANDGSSTYVLVRSRPYYEFDAKSGSLYDGSVNYFAGTSYAFRKEPNPDQDFNSRLDFEVQGFQAIDPLQIVDDVAWSNEGGKEYTRSSDQEISDTPGFNPDGLSRVAYYFENPERGHRFNSDDEVVFTRSGDEEWVYGEGFGVTANLNGSGQTTSLDMPYDPTRVGAPTDPNGQLYDAMGNPDAMGEFLFDDLDATGFQFTPGTFNDAGTITQFRFVAGDVDFSGVVDAQDYDMARDWHEAGATLDDREMRLNNNNTDEDESDDFMYDAFVFEGRLLNAYLVATNMVETDGPMGVANAATITLADIDAIRTLLGFGAAPDMDNDGVVGSGDLAVVLAGWGSDNPLIDVTNDGVVDSSDLAVILAAWGS